MVSLDKAVVARLERAGHRFEVLVSPDFAEQVLGRAAALRNEPATGSTSVPTDKEGRTAWIVQRLLQDLADEFVEGLAAERVFKDSSKGEAAPDADLQENLGSIDARTCALQVLLRGEIQLTTEQRRDMAESKRRRIVAYIARNAINPQTRSPHPPARIEAAMEEAKVGIDPFKPVEQQVVEVIEKLRPLLPIRIEKAKVALKIPGEFFGRVQADLHNFGSVSKQGWQTDGSWIAVVEIPAGLQSDLYELLNKRTKGAAETRLLD